MGESERSSSKQSRKFAEPWWSQQAALPFVSGGGAFEWSWLGDSSTGYVQRNGVWQDLYHVLVF